MGTRKRVLLIDPWEEDRGEIQRRLQSDVPESELISMQTLLEEEHLERLGAVDLILTEWLLPGMKGSEALSLLQQRWPGVPVVVVTRERSPQQVAAAFRAGAKDVLLKSSEDLARLPEVVAAMLSSLSSLSALPPAILHALIENAHETFLILNPDGTIRYGSPAIQRTLGYPPEELSGERLFDLLHPEDLPLAVEVFQQRLHAPNEIATLELRFRHRDGSWRVLEVSGRAVWLDRAIRGLALVCRDLTEQRLIEGVLYRSHQRYEELVHDLDGIVWEAEGDPPRITFLSQHAERLLGVPIQHGERKLALWWDRLHPEDRARVVEAYARAAAEGQDRTLEYRMITAAGRTLWVRDRIRAVRTAGGGVRLRGVIVDITAQKRADQAREVLTRILRALNELPEPLAAFPLIAAEIRVMTNGQRISLMLRDPERGTFTIWSDDPEAPELPHEQQLLLSQTAAGADIQAGRPHISPDLSAELGFPIEAQLYAAGYRSSIHIPIRLGEQVLGALSVAWKTPGAPGLEEMPFLNQVVEAMAAALLRARLIAETRRQAEHLALLNRLLTAVHEPLTLPEVLQVAITELVQALGVDRGAIALRQQPGDRLLVVAEYNPIGTPSGLGLMIPAAENPSMVQILATQRPLQIHQAAIDPRLGPVGLRLAELGIQSLLIVPMVIHGEVIGTIGLDSVRRPRMFSEEEIRLAQAAAMHVAIAVERTRILEDLRNQSARLQILYATAQTLVEPRELPRMMRHAVEVILPLLPADGASVYIADEGGSGRLRVVVEVGYSAAPVTRAVWEGVEETITNRVATQGEPLWVEDCARYPYPPLSRWIVEREKIHSHAAIPMRRQGETLGVLHVIWRSPRPFDAETRALLQSVADLLALGVHSARLLERTREQAARLETLNQALQEALALREQIIQNVSHELRMPLAIILGHLDLILDEPSGELPPWLLEKLTLIRDRARHLRALIEQLLILQDLQKPSILHLQELDFGPWLEEIVRSWEPAMARARLRLRLEIAPDLGRVHADPLQLEQVMNNLLDNARKFSPYGGEVWIRAWRQETEIYVAVADQGIGVPPDQLGRIFDRFYQVDGSPRRRYGGMGIGLALCREIIERHGGRIWAESPGRGLVISFTLPTAASSQELHR